MPMTHALDAYSLEMVEFVRAHQAWAPPLAFALAFGESLAFLSLLIPAWAALIGIGALIGAGNLNFWPIWIAAALGAALGDWLSYWLGYLAPLAPSKTPTQCRSIRPPLGGSRHRDRPFLWSAACIGVAGRRHFSHALLAVSDREFPFSLSLGRCAAQHWGRSYFDSGMGVVVNGFYFTAILDRLCREFERMAVKCSLVPRRCQRDEHASAVLERTTRNLHVWPRREGPRS